MTPMIGEAHDDDNCYKVLYLFHSKNYKLYESEKDDMFFITTTKDLSLMTTMFNSCHVK